MRKRELPSSIRITSKLAAIGCLLILVGCGEDVNAIRDNAYEEGFEAGVYEVCRELGSISMQTKSDLRNCRGL